MNEVLPIVHGVGVAAASALGWEQYCLFSPPAPFPSPRPLFLLLSMNKLHFLEQIMFKAKLSRKHRDFPCTPLPYTPIYAPTREVHLLQSVTLNYHPKSIVHSCCWTFHGFGQVYNDLWEFPGSINYKEVACQERRHKVWPLGWEDTPWRRAWQPTSVFLPLENPMDTGAWWATVHRVAKSWKITLLILNLYSFLKHTLNAINFPLNATFATSHKFW